MQRRGKRENCCFEIVLKYSRPSGLFHNVASGFLKQRQRQSAATVRAGYNNLNQIMLINLKPLLAPWEIKITRGSITSSYQSNFIDFQKKKWIVSGIFELCEQLVSWKEI